MREDSQLLVRWGRWGRTAVCGKFRASGLKGHTASRFHIAFHKLHASDAAEGVAL